jgi:hypothetical protein
VRQHARHAVSWRKEWRPAGGWAVLIAVVALTGGFGVGGLVAYHVVTQPVNPRVIQQPAPSASTHYVTVHPAAPHTAIPHTASRPSIGQADIPGITPYYRPLTPTPTPTPTVQSRAPPTPTPTPTLTPTTEVPTSAPPDTGSPSASVTFPASPF